MADLARLWPHGQESDNRAQLILVSAFALAAIFLALAVLVNSAIFTENLATRSENVESTEALEYRHGVTQYMSGVIAFANENNVTKENNDTKRYEEIKDNISDGIDDAGVYSGLQQAERGKAISLNMPDDWAEEGSRIFQTDGGNFTNNESDSEWDLAEDVENTRAFELEIVDFNQTAGDNFTIVVDGDGDDWRLDINDTTVTVTVTHPDETARSCDYEDTIDVTGATVDGRPCPALEDTEDRTSMQFGAGVTGDYDIEFENGDLVETGNFSLVVAGSDLSTDDDDYAEIDGPGDGPYITPAVYSATVKLNYETARVEYDTEIRIAPGEPR